MGLWLLIHAGIEVNPCEEMDYSDVRVGELSMEEQNGITQYNVSETINRLYSVNIYSAKTKIQV